MDWVIYLIETSTKYIICNWEFEKLEMEKDGAAPES